ncbi:hypothetical protein F5880DRAFT_1511717 [Lentinula raphanica]|nr:hypothetical protein F5880DRAFT_1511717 [Lentinula raphanica]
MDKYSRIAWHTNPNASASLTDTERQLARKLFANTEVAWNHPALQECLRRHVMAKMVRQSSNMNTMTLFSVIWKYECPESRNSHSVWTAMRAELDGVLTELVSCFHVYTKGEYGTGESSSRVRTSGGSKDNQEERRARGTTDSVESGLRQTQYSANFASTTVPVSKHVADSGPAVSNRFFTLSPEPNLQLQFPYAEPATGESGWRRVEAHPNLRGFHSNVGISQLAAPEPRKVSTKTLVRVLNGIRLASASYANMSHALRLDPFAPQAGSHGYETGSERSPHFNYSPGAQQNAPEPSYLVPPYATLDPDIWQGERRYPSQWIPYQTGNGTSPSHPNMASQTVSMSPQGNHTMESQLYGHSGGQIQRNSGFDFDKPENFGDGMVFD